MGKCDRTGNFTKFTVNVLNSFELPAVRSVRLEVSKSSLTSAAQPWNSRRRGSAVAHVATEDGTERRSGPAVLQDMEQTAAAAPRAKRRQTSSESPCTVCTVCTVAVVSYAGK